MNISAGGHAQPALQSGSEIRDDVAEHVVSYDHIEHARIAHHLHRERVHVHVFGGDLGIFLTYFLEHALPQAAGVGHDVGLVAHEYSAAWRAVLLFVALTIFEGMADHVFHAFASVDILLHRDL